VFLVGSLLRDRTDRYPLCVEAGEIGYHPDHFVDIDGIVADVEAEDPERMAIVSEPHARKRFERHRAREYRRKAIIKLVDAAELSEGHSSFCSHPSEVEDFLVFVVFQLNRERFDSHYRLQHENRSRHRVSTSLLDAAITEFLIDCASALSKPDPGADLGGFRGAAETLRAAGNRLMGTPPWNSGGIPNELFQTCATIASLKYEGEAGAGVLAVGPVDHPNLKPILSLTNAVSLRAYRAVRKLLQLASSELCLIADSEEIRSIGEIVGQYDQSREDLFIIAFVKHHVWELRHADNVLMRVSYGEPRLPQPKFREEKFRSDLARIFTGIELTAIDDFTELARIASEQRHGTMLVISAAAESEASRLDTQCTRIRPTKLTPDVLSMVTAIDGAVLVDTGAVCHAIGVILDGLATKRGNSARGARYNSAIRYVENSEAPTIAVVFSEDGTIDFIPDLMPQIHRSLLGESLAQFREIATAEVIDFKSYNRLMGWFDEHRFYLANETCEELNHLKHEAESRWTGDIRVVYADFVASEGLDDSYFL
jgi:hypothetical protein